MRWECAGLVANLPLPHCGCCRVTSPGTAQSNRQAVAMSRLTEEPAASARSLEGEVFIAPGSPSPWEMR